MKYAGKGFAAEGVTLSGARIRAGLCTDSAPEKSAMDAEGVRRKLISQAKGRRKTRDLA